MAVRLLMLLLVTAAIMLLVGGCAGLGAQQAGWSGLTADDGNIYFGSAGGYLIAVDAEGGGELWRKQFKTAGSSGLGCGSSEMAIPIYGTPVVAGELVYVAGYDGKVYALNTSAGAERWVYPRQDNLHSFVGGPVLHQGRLFIGSVGGIIYTLDAETGDLVWEFETGEQIWATPAVAGDTLYIGTFDKKLYAIDIATGEQKWQQPFEAQGPVISTPVVEDGVVFIGSFDRHIYALDAASGELIWQFPETADNGENTPRKWFWASPVPSNGAIYAANTDERVYVIDTLDGSLVTVIDLGSAVTSTPVAVDHKVFIATEDGDIVYIDTDSNSKMSLPPLGGKVTAPLFASEGVVYVHTLEDEIIYKLNAETGVSIWNVPINNE